MEEKTAHPGSLAGKRLGNYQIHSRLGKGGMGEVYIAHDIPLDRPVALKVLRAGLAHDEQLVERFHREARAAAKLNHPNIVQIYAVGTEDGVPYFAMEWIDGAPLDTVLKEQGAIPWQRAMNIVGQVASALETAHARGVIHRDIKPANILIDKREQAHVSDFGVAKVLSARTQLTTEGTYIGTPQYMSPEQCGMGEISPASDLFSLGATAYEMLTGAVPFEGDTPATLIRKITQDPPKPLDDMVMGVPDSVKVLVHRLLEKDTERRYQSAHDVLTDLALIKAGTALKQTVAMRAPENSPSRIPTRRRASMRTIAIVAGVLLLAVMAGAVGLREKRKQTEQRNQAKAEASASAPASAEDALDGASLPAPGDVIARFDANRSGAVEPEEMPANAKGVLLKADRDGDGTVTRDEIMAMRKRLAGQFLGARDRADQRPNLRKDTIQPEDVMLLYDKNADGVITLDEVPAELGNFFRANDLNRDSNVTLQEIEENRARILQRQPKRSGTQ
ncbi:MAG: protein kinase [Candidatus Hydrogenedentes bacterium]|nr:protein kinase [Candidatus Hydrogenedentota bacterium]